MWAAATVRVAWSLMMAGVRVRPSTLADARDHVLASLPEDISVDDAEGLATELTLEFLARVRGEPILRRSVDSSNEVPIHAGWRQQLQVIVCDPVLVPVPVRTMVTTLCLRVNSTM